MGVARRDRVTSALPSGIVSFVFTDIEQSTRLLRRLGDRYGELLDRHFALMRESWLEHGGHELDHAGDSAFVVFQDASQAVLACAGAQRRLGGEPWPAGDEVHVRMGVHTGLASPRGESYVALAVHQAARVMSAGHGGQVLVSGETANRLPPLDGVELVAIGRYRLRDFDGPAPLYQLAGPGLQTTFPAVRAVPADGHNLVAPPTPFVGRAGELDDVIAVTGPRRAVTLTGPGGVGKSRLAIEAGLRVAATWPDGVWLVDLSPLQDPAQVATAVATAVGAPAQGGDRWDDVVEYLRKREALIVLDSCEHLAEAVAGATAALLAACPGCGVLATSRSPVGVVGEVVRRVDPLPRDQATELFADRARAATRDVAVDDGDGDGDARTIAEICDKLDGLPLAIELAAARLGALSLQQVLDGLDDRFRLLRSRSTGVPERQRTMEGLLEWSDRLLGEDERACLRRLGVFGASFTLDAATACAGDDALDPFEVAEVVYSLVDKSLVAADRSGTGSRYRLLQSIRAYALRQLEARDEVVSTGRRLARWYLDWIGPACDTKPGWTSDTGVELPNLRALVDLLAHDEPAVAQQIALTIGRYHDAVNSFREGAAELDRHVRELAHPTPELASLLACLADLQLRTGAVEQAEAVAADAERVSREAGGLPPWDDAAIVRTRLEIESRKQNHETVVSMATDALARELSVRGTARVNSQLGIAAVALGDLATARSACERELAAYEELGDQPHQASAHGNLAEILLRSGDSVAAARHQRRCLALALELGSTGLVAFSLIVAARLSASHGEWEVATRLHAHAESILEAIGLALYDDDRRVSDEMLDHARRVLGSVAFAAAVSGGRALDLPEAAGLAERVLAAEQGRGE